METTGQQVLATSRSDRLRIYSIPAGNNTPLPLTHLDSKKSLRRNDFFSLFWKGWYRYIRKLKIMFYMRRKQFCRHQIGVFQRGNTISSAPRNWGKKVLGHNSF